MEPSGYAALLEVLHWGWTLRIYNLTQLPVAFLSALDWLCDPVSFLVLLACLVFLITLD